MEKEVCCSENNKFLASYLNCISSMDGYQGCVGAVVVDSRFGKVSKTTVELQWLEHLWNHENMLVTGAV